MLVENWHTPNAAQGAGSFGPAIRQLERISPSDFRPILDSMPVVRMSEVSKDFAFLSYTYNALITLLK